MLPSRRHTSRASDGSRRLSTGRPGNEAHPPSNRVERLARSPVPQLPLERSLDRAIENRLAGLIVETGHQDPIPRVQVRRHGWGGCGRVRGADTTGGTDASLHDVRLIARLLCASIAVSTRCCRCDPTTAMAAEAIKTLATAAKPTGSHGRRPRECISADSFRSPIDLASADSSASSRLEPSVTLRCQERLHDGDERFRQGLACIAERHALTLCVRASDFCECRPRTG